MTELAKLQTFTNTLAQAKTGPAAMQALSDLATDLVGAKLLTVTTLDMQAGLARRAYSNQPNAYPVSGTKPIVQDDWFASVHDHKQIFVANTLDEIAAVFPDHDVIGGLGCASVINIPIFLAGDLAATLNLLHEEGYYTPARVDRARDMLILPAMAALLGWQQLPR